jgi:leucyl aminopeptidase (aminopeptidase T)
MGDLDLAVRTVVHDCLGVRPGEDVVVIADPPLQRLGQVLREAAREAGAEAVLTLMDEREIDGNEPARPVAGALEACDVFIAPTTRSLSHTTARKRATDRGARGATMPGVTEDMLSRVMAIDFDTMAARSNAVADALDQATEARVTCPRGTDLRLDLRDRTGQPDDGRLTAPGTFGNIPCGEAFIAPRTGEGTIVAVSLAPLGLTDKPATLVVRGGHIAEAQDGLGPDYLALLQAYGERGTNLAELGVGTNDRATLTGNVLEDEKILGTVHVAFGASAGIGGTVSVPIHLDVVVLEATLIVDGRTVLDHGQYVLDPA